MKPPGKRLIALAFILVVGAIGLWRGGSDVRPRTDAAGRSEVKTGNRGPIEDHDATPSLATAAPQSAAVDFQPAPDPASAMPIAEPGIEDDPLRQSNLPASVQRWLGRGVELSAARDGEWAILFPDSDSMSLFLSVPMRFEVQVTGQIPELRAARIKAGSADAVATMFTPQEAGRVDEVIPNWTMPLPGFAQEDTIKFKLQDFPLGWPVQAMAQGVPVGDGRLGQGITIALLDTGVAEEPFSDFTAARLSTYDAGLGTMPEDDHGTFVAERLGGGGRIGSAPSARVLGVRVTDRAGLSDTFIVAQGIVGSALAGAQIIDVSCYCPYPSSLLTRAVDFAIARGCTVIGASPGSIYTWPATDPRVIAIGGVVARLSAGGADPIPPWTIGAPEVLFATREYHASGLTPAPLYLVMGMRPIDVPAGTTFLAGGIASVMSANPGLSGTDAWTILRQGMAPFNPESPQLPPTHQQLNLSGLRLPRPMNDAEPASRIIPSAPVRVPATGTVDSSNKSTVVRGRITLPPVRGRAPTPANPAGPPAGPARGQVTPK